MVSKEKREAVIATVREFVAANDVHKVTSQQAYEQLFPDQVDFGTFCHCWQLVVNESAGQAAEVKLDSALSASPSTPPAGA